MGIPTTTSAIANLGLEDQSLDYDRGTTDAASNDVAPDGLLSRLDGQWMQHHLDIMGSLLSVGKQIDASLQLQTAASQNKLFVDAFSTLTGNLMKSISRLEQING
jgi:hypothetical protein